MTKLWVREKEKWKNRRRCKRKKCRACWTFWNLFAALTGTWSGNTYFSMNHRWEYLHRWKTARTAKRRTRRSRI